MLGDFSVNDTISVRTALKQLYLSIVNLLITTPWWKTALWFGWIVNLILLPIFMVGSYREYADQAGHIFLAVFILLLIGGIAGIYKTLSKKELHI